MVLDLTGVFFEQTHSLFPFCVTKKRLITRKRYRFDLGLVSLFKLLIPF